MEEYKKIWDLVMKEIDKQHNAADAEGINPIDMAKYIYAGRVLIDLAWKIKDIKK